jgi:C4-dicarboxylate-specific signal transduction histidine kinase
MTQVLLNLLNNSIDALEELDTDTDLWTTVDIVIDTETVSINVTDTGPGIEDDVLEKLMLPFFTTKEVGKGTGLGLSISKGIVEDHKCTFSYDPKCQNTRFVIQLPLLL